MRGGCIMEETSWNRYNLPTLEVCSCLVIPANLRCVVVEDIDGEDNLMEALVAAGNIDEEEEEGG